MARILLVDDNASLLAVAGKILREEGHTVTSTNNSADAICLLAQKPPPELLILDAVMHGGDGKVVIDTLGPSAPPVILITGADKVEDLHIDVKKLCRTLLKPFDKAVLMDAVNECLGRTGVETKKGDSDERGSSTC